MDKIDTLVIGSGGEKGFIYIGVLDRIWSRMTSLKYLHGSSVGSALLFLCSIGYNTTEIKSIVDNLPMIPSWRSISLNNWGLFTNDHIRKVLVDASIRRYGRDITFKEHHQLTGYTLIVCIFNVTKCQNEYVSYTSHPDMIISYAVVMSSTIPFIFQLKEYEGCLYGDGAIGDCLPIINSNERRVLAMYVKTVTTSILWNIIYGPLNSHRSSKLETFEGYTIELVYDDNKRMSREEMFNYGVSEGDKAIACMV